MAKKGRRKTWTRRLHSWSGIVLLLPLAIACVTGMILNHTVDLDLSNRYTSASWIQARYGMNLEGEPEAYGLEGKAYAATWDGRIFHASAIVDDSEALVAAVPLRDGTAVVTASAVHYFDLAGELVETMGSATLPATPIARAGRTGAARDGGLGRTRGEPLTAPHRTMASRPRCAER